MTLAVKGIREVCEQFVIMLLLDCYFLQIRPLLGTVQGGEVSPLSIGMIPARPWDILALPNVIDAGVPDLDSPGVPAHTSSPLATICALPPTSTLIPSLSLAACKYRSEGRSIS